MAQTLQPPLDIGKKRQQAGVLIEAVFDELISPRVALLQWPRLEQDDADMACAYQALWHFEADEKAQKSDLYYLDYQLQRLLTMSQCLKNNTPFSTQLTAYSAAPEQCVRRFYTWRQWLAPVLFMARHIKQYGQLIKQLLLPVLLVFLIALHVPTALAEDDIALQEDIGQEAQQLDAPPQQVIPQTKQFNRAKPSGFWVRYFERQFEKAGVALPNSSDKPSKNTMPETPVTETGYTVVDPLLRLPYDLFISAQYPTAEAGFYVLRLDTASGQLWLIRQNLVIAKWPVQTVPSTSIAPIAFSSDQKPSADIPPTKPMLKAYPTVMDNGQHALLHWENASQNLHYISPPLTVLDSRRPL